MWVNCDLDVLNSTIIIAQNVYSSILYFKKVRELLKKFIQVQVKHVPRAENSRADALAKLETASQEDLGRLIPIEHLSEPSVNIEN